MEILGHKRGDVISALLEYELQKNDGYLPSSVLAMAGYVMKQKDVAFASDFVGAGLETTGKIKNVKPKKTIKKPAKPKAPKTTEVIPEETADLDETDPEDIQEQNDSIKPDMSLVMSGMASFMS